MGNRLQEMLTRRALIQWTQPLVVRSTPASRCVSTVGGQGSDKGQDSICEDVSQRETTPRPPRAVGMLDARTDQRFLGNVPLAMLGLDEDSKKYRALSFLRWEDVVTDMHFKRWYRQLDDSWSLVSIGRRSGGRSRRSGSSTSASHSSRTDTPSHRATSQQQQEENMQERHAPTPWHASDVQGLPSQHQTHPQSTSPLISSPLGSSPPCSTWRARGSRRGPGRALPLRCLSPPSRPWVGSPGGPTTTSNGNSSWSLVLDPPKEDDDHDLDRQPDVDMLVLPVEALADGLPEQAHDAVVRWAAQGGWQGGMEGEEEEGGIGGQEEDEEDDEERLHALPGYVVSSGVPCVTSRTSGSLVFRYWSKAPLG